LISLKNHPVPIVQELDVNGVGRTIRRKLHGGFKVAMAESLTLTPLPMALYVARCPGVLKNLAIVNFESLVVGQLQRERISLVCGQGWHLPLARAATGEKKHKHGQGQCSRKARDARPVSFHNFDRMLILPLCPDGFERMGDGMGPVKTPT
jgi:hypothetical protein